MGCLVQDQVDLLGTESFFTGTVIDSPDGSKHVIQVHDYENTSDGGAKIVDTSGVEYHIKIDGMCETAKTRDGRRLQFAGLHTVYAQYYTETDVSIELYTSLDFDTGMKGVYKPTVSSFDTYYEQDLACRSQGKRLCSLQEICSGRGVTDEFNSGQPSFSRGFTNIPDSVANSDSWVAYFAIGARGDGCTHPHGFSACTYNSWVQIGTWGNGIGRTCKTHCEVTAEFYGGPQCPAWGTTDGEGYTPNSYMCCKIPNYSIPV